MQKYFLKNSKNISILINKSGYLEMHNSVLSKNFKLYFKNFNLYIYNNHLNSYYIIFNNLLIKSKFLINLRKYFVNICRGYCVKLEVIGLGYSVTSNVKTGLLRLNIGYNHSIFYKIPNGIILRSRRKEIFLFSYSFFLLKNVSEEIKNFRKLSIYKLKGIKIKNELYIKKN